MSGIHRQGLDWKIGIDIAVDDAYRPARQMRQRAENSAARIKSARRLNAVDNGRAVARAVAQIAADLRAQPRQIDHDALYARAEQTHDMTFDQRLIMYPKQGLRRCGGEGADA